jgi:hypothetical protein
MITIKTISFINKVEENDDFNSNYTYINKLYESLECEYDELSIEEQNELKFDGITEFKYSPVKPVYYNNLETFDSICTLGKCIIEDFNINNINNVNRLYLKENLLKLTEIIKDWIKENSYPYAIFNKEDFLITFLTDCIRCYALYDIHKWMIKIYNNFEEVKSAPKVSKELTNLIKAVDFMDLSNFVYADDLNKYIQNLPQNYTQIDDFIIITRKNEKTENMEKTINNYYNTVRKVLIGYTSSIIINRKSDFLITKQQPFYEPNKKQYRIIDNANSIIGIAYNKLLLNLTTNNSYDRIICANPNCNNEFAKIGRRKYCKNKACQNVRNAIKSKRAYISKKK